MILTLRPPPIVHNQDTIIVQNHWYFNNIMFKCQKFTAATMWIYINNLTRTIKVQTIGYSFFKLKLWKYSFWKNNL